MSNIYAYCRISTREQSITRQIRNAISRYPEAIIVEEVYTGTKLDGRPKWNTLLKKLTNIIEQ